MGLFGKKSKAKDPETYTVIYDSSKGISPEEVRAFQDRLRNAMARDDEQGMYNAAEALQICHAYEESIQAYLEIMAKFPGSKGSCEEGIGFVYSSRGDYDAALAHMLNAREAGLEEDLCDESIWEVCRTAYEQTGNNAYGQKYIDLCPQGAYLGEAKKLLG